MTSYDLAGYKPLLAIVPVILLSACTAGSSEFSADNLAGFWYGLWHGVISVIALIIHVFNDNVGVYELHNTGGWYDFGFLLGIICVWGGSSHVHCKTTQEKTRDKEWEEIGEQVEKKLKRIIREWAEKD